MTETQEARQTQAPPTPTAAPTGPVLYKVLRPGNLATASEFDWTSYLPTQSEDGTWEPGAWAPALKGLRLCERGYHVTTAPVEFYQDGYQLFRVEVRGDAQSDDGPKSCHAQVRFLAPAPWEEGGVWTFGHHVVREGLCRASGSATVEASGSATVEASGSATVEAYDSATVRASGSATVVSTLYHLPGVTVALNQLAVHLDRRGGKLVVRTRRDANAQHEEVDS